MAHPKSKAALSRPSTFQGGGAFWRIDGSLSLGGEPYQLGFAPSLSGTVHYFQTWFRTNSGPRTGECVGVSIP